jgi:hypothetical protein
MQIKDADGIRGVPAEDPPFTLCAVTRDQLRRPG